MESNINVNTYYVKDLYNDSWSVYANDYDYIIYDSSYRLLTEKDMYGLTQEECRLARNEIYARHGRMFKDTNLQKYFDSCYWYNRLLKY